MPADPLDLDGRSVAAPAQPGSPSALARRAPSELADAAEANQRGSQAALEHALEPLVLPRWASHIATLFFVILAAGAGVLYYTVEGLQLRLGEVEVLWPRDDATLRQALLAVAEAALAAAVALALWFAVALARQRRLGVKGTSFSPCSAILLAVPVVNLVLPLALAGELWRTSDGRRNLRDPRDWIWLRASPLLLVWWALQLAAMAPIPWLVQAGLAIEFDPGTFEIVRRSWQAWTSLLAVAALANMLLVQSIDRRQKLALRRLAASAPRVGAGVALAANPRLAIAAGSPVAPSALPNEPAPEAIPEPALAMTSVAPDLYAGAPDLYTPELDLSVPATDAGAPGDLAAARAEAAAARSADDPSPERPANVWADDATPAIALGLVWLAIAVVIREPLLLGILPVMLLAGVTTTIQRLGRIPVPFLPEAPASHSQLGGAILLGAAIPFIASYSWSGASDLGTLVLQAPLLPALFGPSRETLVLCLLVTPLIGEFVFRGSLFAVLRQVSGPAATILYTAIAFSLLAGSQSRLIPAFVLGLACGLARHVSGGLTLGLVLHVAHNAAAALLPTALDAPLTPERSVLLGLAMLLAGIWALLDCPPLRELPSTLRARLHET